MIRPPTVGDPARGRHDGGVRLGGLVVFTLLGALAATATAEAAPRKPVPKIDLDVRDADVHDVLRLIAEVGRVNLVVADGVSGRVTLKLRAVPWTDALAVVLRTHGLGSEREGGVLLVDTLDNLARTERARADRRAATEALAPLVTVMIPLSYARASEIAPLVAAMLTERGRVTVDARTNVLIVTEVAERAEAVRERVRVRGP